MFSDFKKACIFTVMVVNINMVIMENGLTNRKTTPLQFLPVNKSMKENKVPLKTIIEFLYIKDIMSQSEVSN